ncbi:MULTISPECIES: DUF262 domain-containing protein [Pseudomonas]|uniref:DUF262 domain-containing protein n=1 Tax=Pseudomonas TaxID=286 RepID=UPI00174A0DBE|nr:MULTISPECIES: DUF262 domain-containing protein [Pseudomonas]MBJ7560093.1 DUF262 domain-containing protein [Pseudomonas sp. P20]MBJ7566733.1 DUF262 domain-containing protein [Pseudomonas sp. P22]MBM0727267.1 DUF262 domain-containing protein [Pseudomonas aeruginosa]MBM2511213.1 DUF262 domain-containing protein [Pseudomonas aeruginosa]MBM2527506.1 DUF262 domain-containing protein [Pseudomonas aeruginosa]
MATQTIEQFFTGKTLVIPAYQRDYAWTTTNIDDLFEDIEEAMELGGGHYLGTFILSQTEKVAPVSVVDGQQRLTTLTMLLDALVDAVDEPAIKEHYRGTYIFHPVYGPKFTVLGVNQAFFTALLNDESPEPESDGQQRLLTAYQWIRHRVAAIRGQQGQEAVRNWLLAISHLEVLEFTEANEGKAIRMFQSVNDRGVPLAKMDIAKSLLIYYSNRFLDGELDSMVSDSFGEAFRCFSRLKKLAAEPGYQIRLINRDPFREDDVLRYHYFAFDGEKHDVVAGADYNATSETVLESFLKPVLKRMRSDRERLSAFITAYVRDLEHFFRGLLALAEATRSNRELYLLLVVQDLAATLYPLLVSLFNGKLLETRVPEHLNYSMLKLVELTDLRVFKLQGTNPQADMAALMRDFSRLSPLQIAERLINFCQRFMPSARFQAKLANEDMFRNPGLPRILLEAEGAAREAAGESRLEIDDLVKLNTDGLTIEHVLPQEASFGVRLYGFHSAESYLEHIHLLGNLAPLEKRINSACGNCSAERKTSESKLYRSSQFNLIQNLAAGSANVSPAFTKDALLKRSAELARFSVTRWPLFETDLIES